MSTSINGAPAPAAFQPTNDQVVQFLQRNAVFGDTVRFRQLDRYEAFYRCRAYVHQKFDWWGRSADANESISPEAVAPDGFNITGGADPGLTVRDKRPTAPKNLARTIVNRYTGLLLSEKRKPKVVVEQDADTEAFLEAVRESSKFWAKMRSARDLGGAMGSVAITAHVRDGRFSYDVHNTKHCTPIWKNRRTWELTGLLVMYRYPVEENVYDKDDKHAGTRIVEYMDRRIITEQEDVVYRPIALDNVATADWVPDPALSVRHGLGFFPGVWIQNRAEADDMDGTPDCDGAWQTIDTMDRLLSQMNKGVLLNLDPTPVIKYDETEVAAIGGIRKGSDNAITPGKNGDAKYLEMTGSGIEAGLKLLTEFRQTVCEVTGYVSVDPEKISGAAQSAKAIEYIMAPMLERADDFRAQYGEAIISLTRVTDRIARAFASRTVQLADGSTGVFVFDLPPRKTQVKQGDDVVHHVEDQKLGPGGYISLKWGPYFPPTNDDTQKAISNAAAANAAGFVAKATAATTIADEFGVSDVEGEVARAAQEGQEAAEQALAGAMPGFRSERALAEGTAEGTEVFGRPTGEQRGPDAGAGGRA